MGTQMYYIKLMMAGSQKISTSLLRLFILGLSNNFLGGLVTALEWNNSLSVCVFLLNALLPLLLVS